MKTTPPVTNWGRARTIKMPTTILITPRESTRRTPFTHPVIFDTTRTKAVVAENIEHIFGEMEVIKYPGPVGLQDGQGQPLNCSGEVTFNATIGGKTGSVSAWVTPDVEDGTLVIGSGTLEDLGLQLQDIPAQDVRIRANPSGSSAVTRSSSHGKNRFPTQNNNTGEGDLLLPFEFGFHREIVIGSDDKSETVYYTIQSGDKTKSLRSRQEVMLYLKNHPTGSLTEENFSFRRKEHLLREEQDPQGHHQSVRRAKTARRSTNPSIPQAPYQPMPNDDYTNRGRNQTENPHTYAWDSNRGAGPSSGVPVKMEFDPGPYNTEDQRLNWRRAAKNISSDDTEDEMMKFKPRNARVQDRAELDRLSKAQVQNQQLLLSEKQRDIKQELDAHCVVKQEPDDHPQQQQQRDPRPTPPQRTDPLRTHDTYTPTNPGKPPQYYQRGPPRDDINWEYRPG